MRHAVSLLALTSLTSSVLATPVPNKRTTKSRFSVKQKAQRERRPPQVVHRRTYLKYGVPVPDNVNQAAVNALAAVSSVKVAGNGTGSTDATPFQGDAEYLSTVTIDGTEMVLDFDSGSSDLWVVSSLQASADTTGHGLYEADDANLVDGQTWEIQYGDGSGASGMVYTGTVDVGGVTATEQAIEAATSMSAQFLTDVDTDGLLGLGFASINQVQPTPQTPFFDNIKGDLDAPLWTADLKKGVPGTYDFGFIDDSKYTGELTYIEVDSSNGFWQFTGDGYSIGGGEAVSTQFDAILDTGSSLFYMPTEAVNAYYAMVESAQMDPMQGGMVFDCQETLPDFAVSLAGTQFTVPGDLMNYAEAAPGTCFGGLQDGAGFPFNIFGDVFLKAVFAVFDTDGPQIGLAPQTGIASNSTGGSLAGGSPSSPAEPLSSSTALPTELPPTPTDDGLSETPMFSLMPSATEDGIPVATITLSPDGSSDPFGSTTGSDLEDPNAGGAIDWGSIFGPSGGLGFGPRPEQGSTAGDGTTDLSASAETLPDDNAAAIEAIAELLGFDTDLPPRAVEKLRRRRSMQ